MWNRLTIHDMTAITVSSKYQIVIPKEARKKLKITPGTRLFVTHDEHGLHIAKEQTLEEVRGMLKGCITSEMIDEFDRTSGQEDRDFTDILLTCANT